MSEDGSDLFREVSRGNSKAIDRLNSIYIKLISPSAIAVVLKHFNHKVDAENIAQKLFIDFLKNPPSGVLDRESFFELILKEAESKAKILRCRSQRKTRKLLKSNYKRYRKDAISVARRFVLYNENIAEEIADKVLCFFLENPPSWVVLKDSNSFRKCIRSKAKSMAGTEIRSEKRRKNREKLHQSTPIENPETLDSVRQIEVHEIIRKSIDKLKYPLREIIILIYFHGHNAKQIIAEDLDILPDLADKKVDDIKYMQSTALKILCQNPEIRSLDYDGNRQ